jgi:hypothetical protein
MFFLSSCDSEKINVTYYCGDNIAETVKYSSSLIYGVDISPPKVNGTYPISEKTIMNMNIPDKNDLILVAVNANGDFFYRICGQNGLCGVNDAYALIDKCKNTRGCQIVGGVKQSNFYPFYSQDRNGGHLCAGRTSGEH